MNNTVVCGILILMLGLGSMARAGVLFYDDCEDGPSTLDWKLFGADPVNEPNSILAASAEKARAGAKSYKVVLPPYGVDGTDSAAKRTEMRPQQVNVARFNLNTEYWIGFSIYFPDDFFVPRPDVTVPGSDSFEWGLFSQFHSSAYEACDSDNTNPTGAAYFDGPGDFFNCKIISEIDECSDKVNDRAQAYTHMPFVRGAWNDVVYHFKFDYRTANNPFFKMWINGANVVNDSGINAWNDGRGPYWKVGLYAIQQAWLTVYLDEIRIGDQAADYAMVAPRGSAPQPPSAPKGLTVR